MSDDTVTRRWHCYQCGADCEEAAERCGSCGEGFMAVCACGEPISTLQDACPACDVSVRRRRPIKGHGRRRRLRRVFFALGILVAVALLGANIFVILPRSIGAQVQDALESGRAALVQKDYQAAEVFLRKVIELQPENPRAYAYLARVYWEQGRRSEAVDEALVSVKYEPRMGAAQLLIAEWEWLNGRFVEARRRAMLASETSIREEAHYLLGRIAERLGDRTTAIEEYRRASARSERELGSLLALGDLYGGMADEKKEFLGKSAAAFRDALNRANAFLKDDPKDAELLISKARALYGLERFDESRLALEAAAEAKPDDVDTRLIIVDVLANAERVDRSKPGSPVRRRHFDKDAALNACLTLAREKPDPRVYLALAAVQKRAGLDATSAYEDGIRKFPLDASLHAGFILYLGELPETRDEALQKASVAVTTPGVMGPEVYSAKAHVHEAMANDIEDPDVAASHRKQAAKAFALALGEASQNVGLRRKLIGLLLPAMFKRDENVAVAADDLEKVALESVDLLLSLRADDAIANYWKGRLLLHSARTREEFKEAAAYLKRTTEAMPRDASALSTLGLAQAAAGDLSEATESFRRAVVGGGAYPDLYTRLATAQLEEGATRDAISTCNEGLARWTGFVPLVVIKTRALLRTSDGAADALAAISDVASRLEEPDPDIYLLLGAAHLQVGNLDEARRAVERAMAYEQSVRTRVALARVIAKSDPDLAVEDLKKFADTRGGSDAAQIALGDFYTQLSDDRRQSDRPDEAVRFFGEARAVYEEILARNSAADVARVRLADLLMRENTSANRKRAIELIARVLDEDPNNPEAMAISGRVDLWEDRIDAAVTALTACVELRPRNARFRYYLAIARYRRGEVTAARLGLEQVAGDPSVPQARVLLARLQLEEGYAKYQQAHTGATERDRQVATMEARKLLESALSDPEARKAEGWGAGVARVLLADLKLDVQDLSDEDVRRLQSDLGDSTGGRTRRERAAANYLLGHRAMARGETDEAISFFLRVTRDEPENVQGFLRLAQAHLKKRAYEAAFESLLDARDRADEASLPFVVMFTARAYEEAENPEAAIRYLLEEEKKSPEDPIFPHLTGDVLQRQKRIDEALRAYQRARSIAPDYLGTISIEANVLRQSGRVREARILVETAVRHGETILARGGAAAEGTRSIVSGLEGWLGALDHQEAEPESASTHLARAIELDANAPATTWYLYGRVLQETSSEDAALRAFLTAIGRGADSPDIHFRTGILLLQKDRPSEAANQFRAVLAQEPEHLPSKNNLAVALADAKERLDEALVLAREVGAAWATRSAALRAAAQDTLAWVHIRNGEPETGRKLAIESLEIVPGGLSAEYHLAYAQVELGLVNAAAGRLNGLRSTGIPDWMEPRIERLLRRAAVRR